MPKVLCKDFERLRVSFNFLKKSKQRFCGAGVKNSRLRPPFWVTNFLKVTGLNMWKLKAIGRYIIRIIFLCLLCYYLGQKYVSSSQRCKKMGWPVAPGGLKEASIQTAILFAFVGHSCVIGKEKVNLVNWIYSFTFFTIPFVHSESLRSVCGMLSLGMRCLRQT